MFDTIDGKKLTTDGLKVEILTDIVPKGRPRFYNGRVMTPPETLKCELKLQAYFRQYMRGKMMIPKGIAITMSAEIFVTHGKGDLDNYLKILQDAGNKILFYDDRQINRYDTIVLHRKAKYGKIRICLSTQDLLFT